MARLGLSRTRVGPHSGKVFEPLPDDEAVHGRWGRHWLRGVAVGGVGGILGGAAAVAAARRRA